MRKWRITDDVGDGLHKAIDFRISERCLLRQLVMVGRGSQADGVSLAWFHERCHSHALWRHAGCLSHLRLVPPSCVSRPRRRGMGGEQLAWAVRGVQLGNIALFVCIACGLVALLATATNALAILQFAGAGYLLYFGARIVCSSFRASSKDLLQSRELPSCRRRLVLQALVIQVTNPKALLFVSALVRNFSTPTSTFRCNWPPCWSARLLSMPSS